MYIYIYIVVQVDNSPHIHIHIHGSWLEIIFPPQNSPTKIEYGQSCDPFGIQILSHSHSHPNFEPCISRLKSPVFVSKQVCIGDISPLGGRG